MVKKDLSTLSELLALVSRKEILRDEARSWREKKGGGEKEQEMEEGTQKGGEVSQIITNLINVQNHHTV